MPLYPASGAGKVHHLDPVIDEPIVLMRSSGANTCTHNMRPTIGCGVAAISSSGLGVGRV